MDELKFITSVKKYRKNYGFSQEVMSNKIGVSLRTYQRLEAGEITLGLKQYLKILHVVSPLLEQSLEVIMNSDYFNNFDMAETTPMKFANRIIDDNFEVEFKENHKLCPMIECDEIGYWELNFTKNEYFWTPEMYEFYEIEPRIEISQKMIMTQISNEDFLNFKIGFAKLMNSNAPFHYVHSRNHTQYGNITLVSMANYNRLPPGDIVSGITWTHKKR